MSTANAVLVKDLTPVLDWANVSGATHYHLQVSTTPDFSGPLVVDDATLTSSTHTFTDTAAGDSKRWWRWRSSSDGGITFGQWQTVGHYYSLPSAANEVVIADGTWKIFSAADVTDIYAFPDYPRWIANPASIYREKTRNRLGTLLSEFVTAKDQIGMEFSDMLFLTRETMNVLARFNLVVKTFFVGAMIYDGTNYVPHVWKAQFSADPQFTMLAPGREDYFTGTLEFEEV